MRRGNVCCRVWSPRPPTLSLISTAASLPWPSAGSPGGGVRSSLRFNILSPGPNCLPAHRAQARSGPSRPVPKCHGAGDLQGRGPSSVSDSLGL